MGSRRLCDNPKRWLLWQPDHLRALTAWPCAGVPQIGTISAPIPEWYLRTQRIGALRPLAAQYPPTDVRPAVSRLQHMPRVRKAELFDHLVGAQQDRRWDRYANFLCGLNIHHQLEFARPLNRQHCGFGALQNFGDEHTQRPIGVEQIWPVRY